jgi:hypothetical protein
MPAGIGHIRLMVSFMLYKVSAQTIDIGRGNAAGPSASSHFTVRLFAASYYNSPI